MELAFCLPLIMKLLGNVPHRRVSRPFSFPSSGAIFERELCRVLSSSSSLFLSSSFSPCRSAERPHPLRPFSPRGVEKLIRLMARPCSVTFVKFTGYFGHARRVMLIDSQDLSCKQETHLHTNN